MTKSTLIATAVASIFAASAASADVTTSGIIELQYKMGDTSDVVAVDDVEFNIHATEDLGDGMVAFGNYRIDGGLSTAANTADSVNVGIKGAMGTFTIGEVTAGTKFAELAGDINTGSGIADSVPAVNEGMSFVGKAGDFTYAVGMSPDGSADATTFGGQWSDGTFTVGMGVNSFGAGNANFETTAFGGKAKFGAITVSAMVASQTADGAADIDSDAFKVAWSEGKMGASVTVATYNDDDANTQINFDYKLGAMTNVNVRLHTDGDNSGADYTRIMLSKKF